MAGRTSGGGTFRTDIEGLRGVAIALVIATQAGLRIFGDGYVGVDFFFVLSGYLITGLLARELSNNWVQRFLRFHGRRARRLLPRVSVLLVVTAFAAYALESPFLQRQLTKSAISTVLYASNLYFAHGGRNGCVGGRTGSRSPR